MKVEEITYEVERSAVLRRQKFSISVNSFSIQQLSKNIYSNPIRACIREVSVNSLDAQVANGETRPIEITLPNLYAPNFICKDRGIGLSEDDVFNLYANFFESSKRESNEFTGAIGIGAKSIFAVSQTNQIISCHEGIRSVYSINMDEKGIPEVLLLEQSETDETGFEVIVPVPTHQHQQFKTEAEYVFQFFDQKPIITGQNVTIKDIESKFNGSYFKVGTNLGSSFIVCGNVAYPLSVDYDWPNVLVRAPIGAIDFAPSREQLSSTEKTNAFIRKAKQDILNEVKADLQSKLEELKTEWEVCKFLNKTCDFHNKSVYRICENSHAVWKGREINLGRVCIRVPKHIEARAVENGRKRVLDSIYPGDKIYVQNTKLAMFTHIKDLGGKAILSMRGELWRPIVKWLKSKGAKPEDFLLTADIDRPARKRSVRNKVFQYSPAGAEKLCWVPISAPPEKCYYVYLEGYKARIGKYLYAGNLSTVKDLDKALDLPIVGLRKSQQPPKGGIDLSSYLQSVSDANALPNASDYYQINTDNLDMFAELAPDIAAFVGELEKAHQAESPTRLITIAQRIYPVDRPVQRWKETLQNLKDKYDFLTFIDSPKPQIEILLKYLRSAK